MLLMGLILAEKDGPLMKFALAYVDDVLFILCDLVSDYVCFL